MIRRLKRSLAERLTFKAARVWDLDIRSRLIISTETGSSYSFTSQSINVTSQSVKIPVQISWESLQGFRMKIFNSDATFRMKHLRNKLIRAI